MKLVHINSYEAFNVIDNVFTEILNKARAAVEGLKQPLPFSQCKLKISNQYLYWKLRVKKLQGKIINVERMNRRMELGNIIDNTLTIKEAKEELNKAKKRWEEFKLKAQEF